MYKQIATRMDTIEERLRRVRGTMSRNKFGQLIGKVGRTVERWEKKFVGTDADLLLISEKTGVQFEWLKTGQGRMREPSPVEESRVNGPSATFGQQQSIGLEEKGRSICIQLTGPDGQVLARVDMVLMGVEQPLQVPLTLGVEGNT